MKKILFLICLLCWSCAEPVKETAQPTVNRYGSVIEPDRIRYFKDDRCGKCFAELGDAHHGYTFTWLPCDSTVLALIK